MSPRWSLCRIEVTFVARGAPQRRKLALVAVAVLKR
jgi:hypothetical protein